MSGLVVEQLSYALHIRDSNHKDAFSYIEDCNEPDLVSELHSPGGGQSSRRMHMPSCTTVPTGQLQPGSQISGHGGLGSSHVPSHPLHSCHIWPSIRHTAQFRYSKLKCPRCFRKQQISKDSTPFSKRLCDIHCIQDLVHTNMKILGQ